MLKTLSEAKNYAIKKIEELTWEEIDDTEKAIIETTIEEDMSEKIYSIVSEEEIENEKLTNEDDLEWYLFHRIPNYTTLLEETTINFLTEYLSPDDESQEDE